MQWSDLARRYPNLIAPGAQPNSLPANFQSARTKLWVGIGFGFLMMALGVLFIAATLLIRPV